jgi:AraC-like DNA-binding protein
MLADPVVFQGWGGTALLTDQMFAYAGGVGPADLHAHHAVQILVALGEPFALRDGGGRCVEGVAAVIPRDVRHTVEWSRGPILAVYVSPEHAWGRGVALLAADSRVQSWFDTASPLCGLRGDLATRLPDELESQATRVLATLAGVAPRPPPVHPAIRRLLAELPSRVDGDVRLPALARIVGLSPGRLGHLFSESVGIPLRPYVLWLRIQRAAIEVQRGASLTEAAHAAGFTDSSHASHTFRRMFGVKPSELASAVSWIRANARGAE